VTTGIRAIRLLCRFWEWISDKGHLQGSSLVLRVPHPRPPGNPLMPGKLTES
jgi:hypothetical protein